MDTIDCAIGEALYFGEQIRIKLNGRTEGQLYVFIEAARSHRLQGHDGFHGSAPYGRRRRAHVLVLCDGDTFAIGPIKVLVESVRLELAGAQALRDVRLRIQAQTPYVRRKTEQGRTPVRRYAQRAEFRS